MRNDTIVITSLKAVSLSGVHALSFIANNGGLGGLMAHGEVHPVDGG